MQDEMTPEQAAVVNGLEPGRAERIPALAARVGLDQSQVAAAALQLSQLGFCTIEEAPYREWVLKPQARSLLAAGIPERQVLRALLAHGGRGSLPQLAEWTGLSPKDVGQTIRGLQQRGWAVKVGAELVAEGDGLLAGDRPGPDEALLAELARVESGRLTEDELLASGCDPARARDLFGPRSVWVEIREKTHRSATLTASGEALRASGVSARPLATGLTPELLATGQWRDVRFKPYDVDLATEPRHPGKRHPLQRTIAETRRAFFNMGFEEWHSPLVESSFWDFDALFQPQDHPAREMQDTFYVARPAKSALPADEAMVARVRAAHENGGETGSIGWQYRWNPELARQNILRTHNTATTIRAVAALKHGPKKVFSVGRVFRREAVDYKHLPVFFQVDGIVIDPDANLASLFGTMGAFLEQLGFSKYDFRPDFFPYTEPSVGVLVWNEERRDWFELAGAGIFRPEVTEPLGCTDPVLAWGFGLDRLAMVMHGVSVMRDLYLVDLEWLKGVPLCR